MKKRKTLSLKSKRKATSDSVFDLTNIPNIPKKTSSILSIGSGFQKKNKKTKKSGKTSKSSKTRIPPKKKQKNESNNKTRTKTKTTKLILEKFPSPLIQDIQIPLVSSKEWNNNLFGSEEEEINEASEDEKDSEVFFNATGIHCSKYYSCNAIYQFPENKLVFNGL